MPPEGLSMAGDDYGRAFCLPKDREQVPFGQLSPAEQQCVSGVGGKFQADVDRKLGMGQGTPNDPPLIQRVQATGPNGAQVATLTFADGAVTLCIHKDAAAKTCDLVGYGMDGFFAAQDTLAALGFRVGPA